MTAQPTLRVASRFEEAGELFVHLVAYRTLRAMLKNENGMGFRTLQKPFNILTFTYFLYHGFRLADSI